MLVFSPLLVLLFGLLIGVIGGTLTSGLLGLFIGPVILALFYEMVLVWLNGVENQAREVAEASQGDA